MISSADEERFVEAVMRWSRDAGHGRNCLPWRTTDDPWAVLISEFMLAQTQVGRVALRFPALLNRFPSTEACASSTVGDVVRAWSGLGYNRRALSLHTTASLIVERHGGKVPDNFSDLVALPGIGEYTARAVLAFAFNRPAGVVDVNINRVFRRAIIGDALPSRQIQGLADQLSEGRDPRSWNLALMDFGSLVCTARNPQCGGCPVVDICCWRQTGTEGDPADTEKRQSRFAGSDRQGRGRLLKAACAGSIAAADVPTTAGWPEDEDRAIRVLDGLVAEGMLVEDVDGFRLP